MQIEPLDGESRETTEVEITAEIELEKEPVLESVRFRAFLAAVLLQVIVLLVGLLGIEPDPVQMQLLQDIANAISLLIMGWITMRTLRNTAV